MVLVHGVAFGPETMLPVARAVATRGRAVVVHRRGYGRSSALSAVDVAGQVDDVIEILDRYEIERAIVAGVSGGATTAIAAAIAAPQRIIAAIAHEPALGPLAPGVNGLLGVVAGALLQARSPELGTESVARLLAGPTWGRLAPTQRARVRDAAVATAFEVPCFAAFAPSVTDLAGLRALRLVTSVGALSSAQRHDAASVLANHAAAEIAVIPGAGHLVQIDAPHDFGRLIERVRGGSS